MALFEVVPQLRSRGVTIDIAAWFPWKAPDGTPCADSCGIFVLNLPGSIRLVKGLCDLHDQNPSGILWAGATKTWLGHQRCPVPIPDGAKDDFRRFETNAGPGFPLKTYLPKGEGVRRALEETLTPTLNQSQIEALKRKCMLPKFTEKRLFVQLYVRHGVQQKGSHYPLCLHIDNPGWRSPERHRERWQKWKPAKWGGQDDHQATPQSWWHGTDRRYGGGGTGEAMPPPWPSDHWTSLSWQGSGTWSGGAVGWAHERSWSSSGR